MRHFWSNEELRTRQLAAHDVLREANPWQAIGYRTRRLVINTNRLSLAAAPAALTDLTNAVWRGKMALAYPLFGTTATHFLALRQQWGEERWQAWCRALQANRPFLVDGNSVVVNLVGRGEAWIGLTDSDDIAAGRRDGLPIAELPLTGETLIIRNTVAVVRGPHAAAAEKLFDYLQRVEVAEKLVIANALEGVSATSLTVPALKPDWNSLLRDLDAATAALKDIFLR